MLQCLSIRRTTVDGRNSQPHQNRDDLSYEKYKAFYQDYIEVHGEQAGKLELETREENASDFWHSSRKIRITVSSTKKVPVRADTNSDKFLCEDQLCHQLWKRKRADSLQSTQRAGNKHYTQGYSRKCPRTLAINQSRSNH